MGRDRIELLPGTLELLILRTLTRGEMHGYRIAQDIKLASEDVLRVEEGSLYPALQRLLVKKWVKARWGKSENNRRARYYQITVVGRRQLERELSSFERLTGAVFRVLKPSDLTP
jgi:transcriptional regulator